MVYLGGRRSTETAAPAISRKDGLSLLGRENTSLPWIAATQDHGNTDVNGLADQWITLVTAIAQSCPSIADSASRLLTLLATKQRAVPRLLQREWRIAVLADADFNVFVIVVPGTSAIFVAIRVPALRVVHITHS